MKNLFYILVSVTIFVMLYSCEKEILNTTANPSSGETKYQTYENRTLSIKANDMNAKFDEDPYEVKDILFQSALPDFETMEVTLVKAEIQGDIMQITYSYSGGCRDHEFDLVSSTITTTDPVSVTVQLLHHKIDDPCGERITETQAFNLAPLKNRYYDWYDVRCGEISINIYEVSSFQSIKSLPYEFCLGEIEFLTDSNLE